MFIKLGQIVPTENSISVKKGEVKQLRKAQHSVCRSVIASPAPKSATCQFSRGWGIASACVVSTYGGRFRGTRARGLGTRAESNQGRAQPRPAARGIAGYPCLVPVPGWHRRR
jgi:hypothetical protein